MILAGFGTQMGLFVELRRRHRLQAAVTTATGGGAGPPRWAWSRAAPTTSPTLRPPRRRPCPDHRVSGLAMSLTDYRIPIMILESPSTPRHRDRRPTPAAHTGTSGAVTDMARITASRRDVCCRLAQGACSCVFVGHTLRRPMPAGVRERDLREGAGNDSGCVGEACGFAEDTQGAGAATRPGELGVRFSWVECAADFAFYAPLRGDRGDINTWFVSVSCPP
jgi:hypothetical protein